MKRGPSSIPPKPVSKVERVYINLGRTGDAIASVPLCYLYWKETGKKAAMMVAREFSSFLEGISYIKPEIWVGDWRDVAGAKARCKMLGYEDIVVPQIYAYGLPVQHTESSFLLESWKRVGRLDDFFTTPLVFDNRNYDREQQMLSQLPRNGLPIVLIAADGNSAPFEYRADLFAALHEEFAGKANIIDLRDFQTEHFHDFLGLFDVAACLITIDTGFGQLACGSPVPVVALAADKPTTWYSSPKRPQHVAYIRYNEYRDKKQELLDAVAKCVDAAPKVMIHHVWCEDRKSGEAYQRHVIAKETWVREAKAYRLWRNVQFTEAEAKRSAINLGDTIRLPFLHDMIDKAAEKAADDDVLLLTNADICLVPGLARQITDACKKHGSAFCHRWDFKKVRTHIQQHEIVMGKWYPGCDLFAVTKHWWKQNKDSLPEFVLGRECWDWVFRELVKKTGGVEIKKGIYHEKHPSKWEQQRNLPGNLHNRSYARAWLAKEGIPLAEIENYPYVQVNWP